MPHSSPSVRPSVAVVLASAGRPAVLGDVLGDVRLQTFGDLAVVVSVPDEGSLPPGGVDDDVRVVFGRGLARQRNVGLAAVPDADVVVFFDDDAVPRDDFVERAVDFFERHPEVVALTGNVVLDGATGDEISRGRAENALASSSTAATRRWRPTEELYGCNFAIRMSDSGGELFDDRLPLYSWLEDHDMARRLLRRGRLAQVEDCVIVHRGVKSGGRAAHVRLGYSQVMNPAYLAWKGSFPLSLALRETVWRVGKNLTRSILGAEADWRRERVYGNGLALADLVRGRFTPERIVELPATLHPDGDQV